MDGVPISKPGRSAGGAGPPAKPTKPAALTLASAEAPLDAWPDERLVEQLRRGKQAAGEVLVKRYHEPLLRYLYRQGGSMSAAEELLQQTWLSALDHLDQFKFDAQGRTGLGGMGFKAWLFRIATNKSHDQWRSRGRERNALEGLKLVVDEEVPDASHRLEGRERDERVKRAIEQLPDAQKQVVLLRYYGEMKFVDIAHMLGCPLNTALGRMHKAMIKLKRTLEA